MENFIEEKVPDQAGTKSEEKLLGNASIVSSEEDIMADMLRMRNLENANRNSKLITPKNTLYTRVIKRALDIMVSLPVVLVLTPLNLVFAVCTYLDVGSPILYKQTRTGKDGKPFILYKFRNMNENKDENGKLLPAVQRVTKFGKFMRKFSLDELLGFWSVLKGDMSIIGPRPLPVFFDDRMTERHKMRNTVRPGLECPRVIKLDGEDIGPYHRQFENDVWYAENVSFWLDMKMIFLLVKMVFSLKTRGIHAGGGSYFVGYDENGIAYGMRRAKIKYPDFVQMYEQQKEITVSKNSSL